jgi:eukaryotic-like serine/threonine-protein kinase
MYIVWKRRLLLLGIALTVASFFSIGTIHISSTLYAAQVAFIGKSPHKNIPHPHVSTRMPITQTNCPSPARAAIRVPLAEGKRQNLLYTYNTSKNGFLIRYDIRSGKKTTILNLNNATISDAQISPDGHFVLFVTQVNSQLAIQMVRVDGQGLQTLYCVSRNTEPINFIDDLLWSPDQQQLLFRVQNPTDGEAAPLLQLLDLAHGSLRTVLTPSGNTGYIPRAWSTPNQVYMQGYALNASDSVPPHDVYVLNTSKRSVRHVASIAGYDWDLSLTPDGKYLLLGQGAALPPQGQPQPPSLISEQAAYGGRLQVIYASHVYAVTQIQAISAKTLLFVLGGRFASGARNGLWKINMDGSGLTQLTSAGKLLSDQHTLWSDISRDGRMYAVASYNSTANDDTGQSIVLYGSLNGGNTTVVDMTDVGNNPEIVGWTTL